MSGNALVAAYFEALDAGDPARARRLFSEDCRIFRPERAEPPIGPKIVEAIVSIAHRTYESFETTVLDLVEDGSVVAVRLRHDAVHRGDWRTRVGTFDLAGKQSSWEAMALFRIANGAIVEERVFRDELGMLLDVGAISPS